MLARLLLGCALAVAIAGSARAQEARAWLFNFDSDTAVLQYGTPESDDVVLVISCDPAKRSMQIAEVVGSSNLVPGRPTRLKLFNGAASLDYPGETVPNEMDGTVNVEVRTNADPRLMPLLKTGTAITLDIAGKQQAIPLKGAAPHVAEFEKACFARR